MSWSDLYRQAGARHGVVTLDDARAAGVPATTLRHRAAAEEWPVLHRGVWALPGAPDTPLRAGAAALAAVGERGVLARRSAAWMWGLRAHPPVRPEVLFAHARGATAHDGLVALRSRSLRDVDRTDRQGLRVTTPARTLGDLAAVTSFERLAETVVRARQRGLVELPDLAAQVAVMRKARGIQRLREAVVLLDGERVDSMLEHDIRAGLANARLPAPAREPIWLGSGPGRLQIDIAWPELRVGIEVDGFAWHHSAEDLARDHRKGNVAAAAGWILLRVGYLRWRTDRAGFLAEARTVLSARNPAAAGPLVAGIGHN
ncbi:MAG TPA: type IV toxin-antitoxin system AbiEi family antitoxin domain-containing protein [Egibacteraceae bacterium]|nr:type IV toxin-antitoxin system AbiEi family antitoxin domain-containing protein [Egibacteraceae bacterium]